MVAVCSPKGDPRGVMWENRTRSAKARFNVPRLPSGHRTPLIERLCMKAAALALAPRLRQSYDLPLAPQCRAFAAFVTVEVLQRHLSETEVLEVVWIDAALLRR